MRQTRLLFVGMCLFLGGCVNARSWTTLVGYYPDGQTAARSKASPPKAAPALSISEPPTAQLASAKTVSNPPPQAPAVPELPSTSENSLSKLRELQRRAAERHATMDTYMMRLRRREVVNNTARPEEIMLVKFRREPWSVYFKWLGEEAKGREVVYVKDRYNNQIHTLTAAGDIPLMPAGKRISVAVDSILARSKSRYPITEAGLGFVIDGFGRFLDNLERGDARGSAKYLGQVKRPEFENKVEAVLQVIPPGSKNLTKGGQRLMCFDVESHLPVLIITQDETGREVEYYCHDRIQSPVGLDDDDFNPDVLWKKK